MPNDGEQPRSTNVLDDAVRRVRELDPSLAAVISREVASLRDGRKFGLVFNRHLPESVRLPNHPVKRGVKVTLRNQQAAAKSETDVTWRVARVTRADSGERLAFLVAADGETLPEPRPVSDLVVVREFGEPVYPGLTSVDRIQRGKPDDPFHVVINGENHHALQALKMTHQAKVDLIYIDPPYNTGNQGWIYNDKYVDVTKGDASSKWLSFMERRLVIAKELLKETGVLIVAIGDDEHHHLRMLLDQIFGAQNFLSNIVWQGGRKNDSRYVSNGADYMLIYARDESSLSDAEIRWREEKPGVHEVLAQGARVWAETDGDQVQATQMMRAWFKEQPKDSPAQSLSRNVYFLPDGTLCSDADMAAPEARPNRCRLVLSHPATGQPCAVPANGWRVEESTLLRYVAEGRIIYRDDHSIPPRLKKPLAETQGQVPLSVFERQRTHSGRHLQKILGDGRFPFPKDHEVLMRWIRIAAPMDAVVLDYFGGSGTTAEAVMRLNAEDGGIRRSIVVTNNELAVKDAKRLSKEGYAPGDPEWEARGVFEYVTRPRISTVVTGTRPDGSRYSEGLEANVEFFDFTYLDESRVERAKEYKAIAPLLWLRAGARGDRIDAEHEDGYALTAEYGVLFTEDGTEPFLKTVADRARKDEPPTHVFVVTDSPSHYEHVSGRLPRGVQAVQLYESYLRNFEINVEAR
ncbi:site-specific DNA-methyltransferase [Nocardioides pakistanensis]